MTIISFFFPKSINFKKVEGLVSCSNVSEFNSNVYFFYLCFLTLVTA